MSGGTIHGISRRNPSEGLASKFPYRGVCSSKHWLKVIMAIVDSNKVLQLPILFLFLFVYVNLILWVPKFFIR